MPFSAKKELVLPAFVKTQNMRETYPPVPSLVYCLGKCVNHFFKNGKLSFSGENMFHCAFVF